MPQMPNFFRPASLALVDLCRGTNIKEHLLTLEKSQWLEPQMLLVAQMANLQRLLRFASAHVPFYMRLFIQEQWAPDDFRTLADWQQLPVVTKSMIRQAPTDFVPCGVRLRYKSRQTGGSTGEPLSYKVSNDAFGWVWAAMLRAWQSSGYAFGDKMVTLGGVSLHSHSRALGGAVYDMLCSNTPVPAGSLGPEDLDKILQILQAKRPSLVYGYPSILYLISLHILEKNRQLPHISEVITTSETLFDGQRDVIERAFGAPVYNVYGCAEAGLTSSECENHRGFHYAMETSFVEVLDECDHTLPAGQPGRIIATNLLNRAMCLIRYDTGDIGEFGADTCSCGRGLRLIQALYGRTRDLIRTPSKKIIHGVLINHVMYKYPWVDRYQLIQRSASDLQLLLAISRQAPHSGLADLRREVASLTGMSVNVEVNAPFVKTPGGKTRVILSCEHDEADRW